ncbi:DNA replication and repair protein RecN [Dokdonia sp. Hel_I_63]|uniref:DNA repair protein RecN n=1 Tax=unclassified Dokdonia TaxID=2615033 RepID=UPI00020A6632|nr:MULTISPECIES: DNA repair protein RecN [unclassified Dokdonia]AEE18407.1 DNA repair protein RecN [Dokdonia sp. 4H-3-7-5]TVZ22361.1 DNA replication and repair protein RecN [Dokdonia sp. Hel_I_63]
MLTSLSIKNYALIQSVQLRFDKGFTVITGETGAGKSILLGALGLITGKRADMSSAGDATQKCIVEGVFHIDGYQLHPFFKDHDLDYENATIVRREILPSGKSRAFINDTPVTLAQLTILGARLVDIHSQNKTLQVVENDFQFEMIDTFSDNLKLLGKYKESFKAWKLLQSELKELLERKKQAQLEYDYQSFLFTELDEASLKEGEYESLEEELNTLSNADEIMQQLAIAVQNISLDENGAIDQLTAARAALSRLNSYGTQYTAIYEQLNSALLELEDIGASLSEMSDAVDADPLALERLNNRMQLLHSLLKKHQVATVEELIAIRNNLDNGLQDIAGVDDKIQALEDKIKTQHNKASTLAAKLHKERTTAAPHLKSLVEKLLIELGMPNAQFQVSLAMQEDLHASGNDVLEFLFSANKGSELKPLGKGASGGELSRVMLALKSVLSKHKQLPTLIFDEIDTGVSGDIAVKMGGILKKMGRTMQLISITHLPQIAGQGASHFKVYKKDTEERTQTFIEQLDEDARIVEIAAMLGGNQQSQAAIDHAKNLLN